LGETKYVLRHHFKVCMFDTNSKCNEPCAQPS